MGYHKVIASRITGLCQHRRLSINQLAKMGNLKQSSIDNIIHGRSKNPKAQTFHKIAHAFGMSFSEFIDFPEMDEVVFDDDSESDETDIGHSE